MNTQPLHEKLRLAAHIAEHNLAWEYLPNLLGEWTDATSTAATTSVIGYGWEIRLADGWLPHYGGECPVPSGGVVNWKVRCKRDEHVARSPCVLKWDVTGSDYDIIAWRPAKAVELPDPDPYADLKRAHANGEPIQILWTANLPDGWTDTMFPDWTLPADRYRVKPKPFKLRSHVKQSFPGLREEHKFHRNDFTAEDLPPGYRPLLLDEEMQPDDEYGEDYAHGKRPTFTHRGAMLFSSTHMRTTRPLPVLSPKEVEAGWVEWPGGECPVEPESIPTVLFYSGETQEEVRAKGYIWGWTRPENAAIIAYKPDPYGKFRQALADGKKVQLIDSERWFDLSEPTFSEPPDQYRIVPEKKRVKLGLEDVPPGSVIRWKMPKQFGWVAVEYVCAEGLWLPVGDVAKYFKWDRLAEHCEINRSIPLTGKWDASAWEPCYKEVEV
ncbi:MAG: hypothetical protein E6Q97_23825 [Desulfurellales bacterium]|nr:MAG: hypothetical protein E6Q97_23825 [Desulfurellales bacterium]